MKYIPLIHLKRFALLVLLATLVLQDATGQNPVTSEYEATIMRAEQYFHAKDYKQAKSEYEKALRINPAASYPKIKLQQLRQFYTDPLDETRYQQYIANGEKHFARFEYAKARENFENAMVLKPEDAYPRQKLREIQEAEAQAVQKRAAYTRSIAVADSLFQMKQYQQAANEYLYASGLLPAETYPRTRLDEIQRIFDNARKQIDAYQQAIDHADQAYMLQDYTTALASYQHALKLRPAERYPADMIERIRNLAADQATLDETYQKVISRADEAFVAKDYARARTAYQHASGLKPSEKYPEQRLAEIDAIFAMQEAEANALAEAREKAEQFYAAGNLSNALEWYKKASRLDPANSIFKQQIQAIETTLEKQNRIRDLLKVADQLFNQKAYQASKEKYKEVLVLEPSDSQASDRIAEIDRLIAALSAAEIAYNQLIIKADSAFTAAMYEKSLGFYTEAGKLKPEENHPKQQAEKIRAILKEIENNRLAFEAAIKEADQLFVRGDHQKAIEAYEKALGYNPQHQHSKDRIARCRELILEAEKQAAYDRAVDEARKHEAAEKVAEALASWKKASEIKPTENLPKEKISELSSILEAERRKVREAYEKAIADGNRYYETKVFDQAIEAYSQSLALMPDATYPAEQIAKIRKYIEDRLLIDLVREPVTITSGNEIRFEFRPVEMRVRRNNYVVVKVRFTNTEPSRFFVNYGQGSQQSGGIVVRNPGGKDQNDFLVRISAQDRWYRLDNDWISIYAEGSDIEISQLRISAVD